MTTKEIETVRKMSKTPTLIMCLDEQIQSCRQEKRLGSANNYLRTRQDFIRFLGTMGRKDLSLRKCTPEILADYQEWILSRGKSRNTLSFHMRNLRAVYHIALNNGFMPPSSQLLNPFEHVCTSSIPTRKRAAKAEVMTMLNQLDISEHLKSMGKQAGRRSFERMVREVTFARDTFVFCFCTCGLPFVDFVHLTKENIQHGMLCYERQKTGTHIEIAAVHRPLCHEQPLPLSDPDHQEGRGVLHPVPQGHPQVQPSVEVALADAALRHQPLHLCGTAHLGNHCLSQRHARILYQGKNGTLLLADHTNLPEII